MSTVTDQPIPSQSREEREAVYQAAVDAGRCPLHERAWEFGCHTCVQAQARALDVSCRHCGQESCNATGLDHEPAAIAPNGRAHCGHCSAPFEVVEPQRIRRRQLTTVGHVEAEISRRVRMYRGASGPDYRARAEALEAVLTWLEEPIR